MPEPEPPKASEPTPTKATPKKEFEPYKGKIRKSGTGCVTMINDHLYEGRFTPRVGGKRISKNVYAKTREECEEKLAELIKTMKSEIAEIKKQTKNAYQRGLTKSIVSPQKLRCRKQRNIYCLSSRGFAKISSFLSSSSFVARAASRASVPMRSTVAPRRSLTYPFSLYQSMTFSITEGTSSAEYTLFKSVPMR